MQLIIFVLYIIPRDAFGIADSNNMLHAYHIWTYYVIQLAIRLMCAGSLIKIPLGIGLALASSSWPTEFCRA